MLKSILGSTSSERILLFILVNECAYLNEIQRAYETSLAPLQHIFRKFEKEGILICHLYKNRKLYRLNPSYFLFAELKLLLKKAFIHLPPEEKRRLVSQKSKRDKQAKDSFTPQKRIAIFWNRLLQVQRVTIQSSMGEAFGEVQTTREDRDILLFRIKGHWEKSSTQELNFSNTLRWTLDHSSGTIGLEHLRYGPNHPVFLFHLAPLSSHKLESIDSHLCKKDFYFGRVTFSKQHIHFLWRVLGPHKNELIHHTYY